MKSLPSRYVRGLGKAYKQLVEQLKSTQQEKNLSDADLVDWVWQGILDTFDWNARPDQIDAAIAALVKVSRVYLFPHYTH